MGFSIVVAVVILLTVGVVGFLAYWASTASPPGGQDIAAGAQAGPSRGMNGILSPAHHA
jgi:hypothetical protein